MPQLSIVIPHRHDDEDFEATLVSVLENRPAGSEVLVCHDGTYSDPFDLADEVDFVTADASSLVGLVTAAIRVCSGDVVHVLGDGVIASEGWSDSALEQFEDEDVGCVIPVITDIDSDSKIVSAGWVSDRARIRRFIAGGASAVGRLEAERVEGAFLTASFWRHSVLQRALDSIELTATGEAEAYLASYVRRCGQELRLVNDSVVATYAEHPDLQLAGFQAGFRSQLHQQASQPAGLASVVTSALVGGLLRPLSAASWATSLGRVAGKLSGNSRIKAIQEAWDSALDLPVVDQHPATVAFPTATSVSAPLRRAA